MSVDVITFGCRLNLHESDAIRRHAESAGLADAVVVNTCAVTGEAVAQARQTIRKIFRERGAPIVVTGCAAQTDPAMFAAMPEVARVIGNHDKLQANAWIALRGALDVRAPDGEKTAVSDVMTLGDADTQVLEGHEDRTRAFLQVQNGCDHRCTFCIIPFGRGNSRSVTPEAVVARARELVERGYREIVLTGVDLTSYGEHLPGAPKLGALVKQILAAAPDLARLRLSSIDAVEVDDDLLHVFANDTRLMPHLHLSLQAGDDMILKRMKRRHARADAIAFCEHMRRLRPEVVFGADIIAGFPTETDDMFQRSLDLVDECGLTHLHVFPFSPRPGTPAARMPQVRGDVVKERARRLRERGEAALRRHLDTQIGATHRVLTEHGNAGRTEQFTQVRFNVPVAAGNIFDVAISNHDGKALIAA
ncbi:MAG: tRNA (N(6)-L-threonylcarbamoyladenosine(37)-C(2))-methylthiotransferase MtaB [Xanthobacteraceae bacterium]